MHMAADPVQGHTPSSLPRAQSPSLTAGPTEEQRQTPCDHMCLLDIPVVSHAQQNLHWIGAHGHARPQPRGNAARPKPRGRGGDTNGSAPPNPRPGDSPSGLCAALPSRLVAQCLGRLPDGIPWPTRRALVCSCTGGDEDPMRDAPPAQGGCVGGVGGWGQRKGQSAEGGGIWHKASVSICVPLAAPIGLSPLLILTLCGPDRVLVVSTEPPDDLSCLTTPGVGRPGDGAVARAVDQGHPDAHSEGALRGLADSSTDLSALGCASAGSFSCQGLLTTTNDSFPVFLSLFSVFGAEEGGGCPSTPKRDCGDVRLTQTWAHTATAKAPRHYEQRRSKASRSTTSEACHVMGNATTYCPPPAVRTS